MFRKNLLLGLFIVPLFLISIFCNSNGEFLSGSVGDIKLPSGFKIDVYAGKVPGARSMTLSESGVLFVGTISEGKVYAILDTNKDYQADKIITIASGLNTPNGVALRNGDLYVAEISRVLKYPDIENRLNNPPSPIVVNDSFPTSTHHGWKFIRFGPDGKLYVPVGAPCNICLSEDKRFASIMRMNPDGSDLELFASGIRNTVGFDWSPVDNVLWFTDNGRDMLGDNIPPDELNRAPVQGMNFGYPFMHGNDIRDPEFGQGVDLSKFTKPAQELGPHVASLGMRFYTGNMFPPEYKNSIFIAEHGSWNRSKKIGYRVTFVKLDGDRPLSYTPFATGWLQGESVSGRPVDLQQMQDGSLLVSDDYGGMIYRISYQK
ncbi:MAG TPA: sorbosone dehydrogenase family protein [Ignavibacteriaceae bacterium]|nr:sorbosone dehydrogenase family protein [Ignavibacteriaceae bacterium]